MGGSKLKNIIGVRFKKLGKIYFFNPKNLKVHKGDKVIVEIKPYSQCQKPDATDSQWLKEAWVMNMDKWKAAKEFAESRGMKFIVVNEKFFE